MRVKQVYMVTSGSSFFKQLIVVYITLIALSACQHQVPQSATANDPNPPRHKASTPSKRVSTSDSLPLSRYGNPLRYRVAGEEYEVKRSARNFTQQGIASWYGEPFHDERTSSGEVYDMYQMTAAHKKFGKRA